MPPSPLALRFLTGKDICAWLVCSGQLSAVTPLVSEQLLSDFAIIFGIDDKVFKGLPVKALKDMERAGTE